MRSRKRQSSEVQACRGEALYRLGKTRALQFLSYRAHWLNILGLDGGPFGLQAIGMCLT